jgi:hypothetical protein
VPVNAGELAEARRKRQRPKTVDQSNTDSESEPSMKRITMRQKTMFTFYFEDEDFDIAFIPKSKEAEKTIRAKADANGQSLAEYFQNAALADLALAEFTD